MVKADNTWLSFKFNDRFCIVKADNTWLSFKSNDRFCMVKADNTWLSFTFNGRFCMVKADNTRTIQLLSCTYNWREWTYHQPLLLINQYNEGRTFWQCITIDMVIRLHKLVNLRLVFIQQVVNWIPDCFIVVFIVSLPGHVYVHLFANVHAKTKKVFTNDSVSSTNNFG